MCRHIAYLGPPITLHDLLIAPPHSLHRQAWEPKEMTRGTVNADGFGVGWYDAARRPEPARYRQARPMWTDRSFQSLAGLIASGAVVASVRNATEPSPSEESGTQPFTEGSWLFSHNGSVTDYHTRSRIELWRQVSDRRAMRIDGAADSEILFALALDGLDAGAGAAEALRDVVKLADKAGGGSLNLILMDGRSFAATARGESLYVLDDGERRIVASEPFDDDSSWTRVPDGSLVEASAGGGVTVSAL